MPVFRNYDLGVLVALEDEKLFQAAKCARENAHAPYTHYKVGAALLTEGDEIVMGCNVEYSSIGLTVCAERNALSNAIVQGKRKFSKLVILSKDGATPCGMCRQAIWDLCQDIPVVICDDNGKVIEYSSAELLPHPFEEKNLKA